jgi:hypothetical protein
METLALRRHDLRRSQGSFGDDLPLVRVQEI